MANTVAYGFVGMEHLFRERVTASMMAPLTEAIRMSVAEQTRQINAMFAEANLVERTTEYTGRYALLGSGTLQPIDQWGNPIPTREEGYYDLAWPVQGGGDAFGSNRVSRAHMTVEDVNRLTIGVMMKDADWMRRHILAAIYDNATWSYTDPKYGVLTVQPLANGDTVTYPRRSGSASTDTHFLAQASAIDNTNNPYDDIYTELQEHPGNTGPFVAYIPTDLVATTEALTNFVPVGDSDILLGANSDRLVGNVLAAGPGDLVRGKVDGMWIIEWGALPSGYIVAHARGGDPPIRMREYAPPGLQGLFPEFNSVDGNLEETRFLRFCGFGAFNRTAALVYRIGNGTYAIPTGYDAPLAV